MSAIESKADMLLREIREPEMARIPEGWFLMGSETGQDNEGPMHRVWVDGFELAKRQVTNADFARYLEATGAAAPQFWNDANFNHPEQPVAAPSWFDAVNYCEWLSRETGKIYRLPTEAEWERAARGGVEGRLYSWGDEPPQELSGYSERWKNGPEPVGRYMQNAYGLYDIGDNVHEWCADWYAADYYAQSPDRNPQGPAEAAGRFPRRSSRGGSWRHQIKVARCAARSSIPPEFKYADYGFRVARTIER
jgi:sulfatase modifying factor 1